MAILMGDDSILTLLRLDFLIAPEGNNEEKSFCKLEDHIEERKEEKWSDDFRGEGHIEDGRTELKVLESCFHADGASAAVGRNKQCSTRQWAALGPVLPPSDALDLQHSA